jgi:hypothetical protein
MGGGVVKRWEQQPLRMTWSDGRERIVERSPIVLRDFEDSEGLVLRELGRAACEAAAWVLHDRTWEFAAEVLRIGREDGRRRRWRAEG